MTSLTIEIVAHTKREKMARALSSEVEADRLWLDNGTLGEWKNHEQALRAAAASGATHAVILQDDAIPIENFREHVLKVAEQRPNDIVSLYVGTHRPRKEQVLQAVEKAEGSDASWLVADTLMWGVGLVIPVKLINPILKKIQRSKLPYDQRIGLWAELTGRDVYYTWPSLVDHADQPTVIRGRGKSQGQRVAHRVGVPSWSSAEVRIERALAQHPSKNDLRTA